MVHVGEVVCPNCGCALKYYDTVARGIRKEYGISTYISVRRLRCTGCNRVHRELPDTVIPYKRYERRVIFGLVLGTLQKTTIEFMDYPAMITLIRWLAIFTRAIVKGE